MQRTAARALLVVLVLGVSGALFAARPQALSGSEAKDFQERASALYQNGRYAEALALSEQWAKATEESEGQMPGAALAVALNGVAWYALFAKDPARTLAAAERSLTLAPGTLGPESNRAHALLFLGRTEEAIAVYIAHKGETLSEDSKWEAAILNDFAEFRARGLDHPQFAAVQKALDEAQQSPEVLNESVIKLSLSGKYAEAIPLAERYVQAVKSAYGENNPKYASALGNLAALYQVQGRYAKAEPLFLLAFQLREGVLGKEHPDTLTSMNSLADLYRSEGRYSEAEPLFQHGLEARERVLGKENPDTLRSVSGLAELYEAQGRYAQAERLVLRVLNIRERMLGKEHPGTLSSVNSLAILYRKEGRYPEAAPLFQRVLEASERMLGKDHPDTLTATSNLAEFYRVWGLFRAAGPLYKRALDARARVLGQEHPDTLESMSLLAELYRDEGQYRRAEPLYKRALESQKRVLGKEHPNTLTSMNSLALLYKQQGRYTEAEPVLLGVLEASERTLGKEHPHTLTAAANLAGLYRAVGRYDEAEALWRRALEAQERTLGEEHPDTLDSISSVAELYQAQGRFTEAEPLEKRVLDASERVSGKEHPGTLIRMSNMALLYGAQGRYPEAEPLARRVLEIRGRVLGKDHPDTLASVNGLAALYQAEGRYTKAEPLYRQNLAAQKRVLGKDHPATVITLNNLAVLHYMQGDWAGAARFWGLSNAAIARHTQPESLDAGQPLTGKKESETRRLSWQFWGYVKAAYRLRPEGRVPRPAAGAETFQTAQRVINSEAAQSLAQMAARGAAGDPKLAPLTRERQDLAAEWQSRDRLRSTWFGRPPQQRDPGAEGENAARLAAIDARIKDIDHELESKFPDYAALASPGPLTVQDVQRQLGAGEALVLFLETQELKPAPEETFIWVVTKTDVRWVRSELGTAALRREVQALRCGLDSESWAGTRCGELTGQSYTDADRDAARPLPFDHARAYKLYHALFGQIEELIKGKQLLLIPSGPLTQLPFQVLVTAPPAGGASKSIAWLIRDHALSVLPAVSSLKALRRTARPSKATKPIGGFGNPLLDGPDERYASLARLARSTQTCAIPQNQQPGRNAAARGGIAQISMRGGLADVDFLRNQVPLPETADELCSVARDLGADPGEIRLGSRASEGEVKALSASRQLAQYRVVHFATHGALAGEVRGTAEPGLLLTPPAMPSEEDDGFLTAPEIASLKLDADWVILSACNTAAGSAQDAEALSGLARAFFYAGARALLVSHWAVDSKATVKLITGAMRRLASDKSIGRAEALRQSMLALIDNGEPYEAHPALWAPFAMVGEGGAAR
jgi:CHAT domain-containing protein/tetratricopeptide (TPR) repeat protein